MRYVRLSGEEKQYLEHLHKTDSNSVVRGRCMCLLLSAQGKSLVEVAKLLNIHWNTVSRLLDKWDAARCANKFSALYSDKGKGAKVRLRPVADLLPALVEKHNRNLKPILEIPEKEHSIKVSKITLQNFLKGAGL